MPEIKNGLDVSIDLETLGTAHDAPIIALGAVLFNRDTGVHEGEFYCRIDWQSNLDAGRIPSASTLQWWLGQSDAARAEILKPAVGTLVEVLQGFASWCYRAHGETHRYWGNGATFDVSIPEHAYTTALRRPAPWKYRNVRDMRTLVDAATACGFDVKSVPPVGVAHSAIDDARYQADVISAAWRHLTEQSRLVALQRGTP